MKKIVVMLVFIASLSTVHAQYKKASFFDKQGRTYGINAELHFLGDGRKTAPGFVLSFGRDQVGRRLFTYTDIRVIPSFKFAYDTRDFNANPVTVSGKSKLHLTYGMNWGFYLRNNDDEEQKFKPFLTAGFNVVILGGLKELDNDQYYYDVLKRTPEQQFSTGLGGGAGAILNLSSSIGLKIEGGYTYQFNFSTESQSGDDLYYMYTPHPYAALGLRFRVSSE